MKKSLLLVVSLLMLASTALVGCGGSEETTEGSAAPSTEASAAASGEASAAASGEASAAPEAAAVDLTGTKIEIKHAFSGKAEDGSAEQLAVLQAAADKVKADTKAEVELKYVAGADIRKALPGELDGGTASTGFDLFGGTDTKNFVGKGQLLDLTAILAEVGLTDSFQNLSAFTVDGKVYGLPFAGSTEGFFYNKKMFKEAGFETFPATFDDLVKALTAIKEKKLAKVAPLGESAKAGWVPGMLAFNGSVIRQAGADFYDKANKGESKWDSPEAVKGLEQYAQLATFFPGDSISQEYGVQTDQLLKGEVAAMFDGSWKVAALKDNADIGFANYPNTGGPGDGFIFGDFSNGFGFNAKADANQQKAIAHFIKSFYTTENATRFLEKANWLPALKGVSSSNISPLFNEVLTVLSSAKGTHAAYDAIVKPGVNTAIDGEFHGLIQGKTKPADVAKKIQEAQEKANKE